MRVAYCLPSGDYNIHLSEEEFSQLLKTGSIMFHVSRTPCTTSRAIFNGKTAEMEFHDRKEISNDLRFFTHESVADLEAGDYNVQFLRIIVDKNKEDTHGTEKNQDGADG